MESCMNQDMVHVFQEFNLHVCCLVTPIISLCSCFVLPLVCFVKSPRIFLEQSCACSSACLRRPPFCFSLSARYPPSAFCFFYSWRWLVERTTSKRNRRGKRSFTREAFAGSARNTWKCRADAFLRRLVRYDKFARTTSALSRANSCGYSYRIAIFYNVNSGGVIARGLKAPSHASVRRVVIYLFMSFSWVFHDFPCFPHFFIFFHFPFSEFSNFRKWKVQFCIFADGVHFPYFKHFWFFRHDSAHHCPRTERNGVQMEKKNKTTLSLLYKIYPGHGHAPCLSDVFSLADSHFLLSPIYRRCRSTCWCCTRRKQGTRRTTRRGQSNLRHRWKQTSWRRTPWRTTPWKIRAWTLFSTWCTCIKCAKTKNSKPGHLVK